MTGKTGAIIDGPELKNVGLGLFRDFRFTERFQLQFRAEAINAFNIINLTTNYFSKDEL